MKQDPLQLGDMLEPGITSMGYELCLLYTSDAADDLLQV